MAAKTQPVPVMQCPVAGFQHHGGEACWARMSAGDALALKREPGNRHDPRAITVEWQGVMLGYVPREANYALSQMMDRGERVEGRVRSLRAGDPWQRVMMDIVLFAREPVAQPNEKAAFDPSPLLVRSLANRIFGSPPPAGALEWVAPRAGALALVGVEHPALLPFLRMVDTGKCTSPDPLAAMHVLLQVAGMEAGAWKRLERWGFGTFRLLGPHGLSAAGIACYANLLLRMDMVSPPPPEFAMLALAMCRHRLPTQEPVDFERYPLWFMHAALKGLQLTPAPDQLAGLVADARCAIDWLMDAAPLVDANQQHAGWAWVIAQARAFKKARALAAKGTWRAPMPEMTFGKWWVVPILSPAQLADEAAAMKNCLEDYEDDFRSGNYAVYSIRDALTGERFACFSAGREAPGDSWCIEEIAGKMNRRPGDEMCAVAEMAVERINRAAASKASTP